MVCPGPLAKRALPCVCTQVLAGIHLPSSQARVQAQQHTPYVSLQARGTSNHMRAAAIGFCLAPGYAYNTIQQGQAHLNKHTTDTHPLAQPPQNTVDRHKRRRGTCCCEPALLRLVSTKQRASQAPGPHVKTSVGLCCSTVSGPRHTSLACNSREELRATNASTCVQQPRALACAPHEPSQWSCTCSEAPPTPHALACGSCSRQANTTHL